MTSERYCDVTPEVIVAKLADEGKYLCSASSMYRILKGHSLNAHRRRSKVPVREEKIPTIATGPNQVWSWDITYLRSWVKGLPFKLYVYEDIYSRKVVKWHVDEVESEEVAQNVLVEALQSEKISGQDLRLHNDNGNVMKSFTFTAKAQSLGIKQSFSRPSVSNDNPFIESLFKTVKYSPQYPYKPFKEIDEARQWLEPFFKWYNEEHLHSKIGYITPNHRHNGEDISILKKRDGVYRSAWLKQPERWSKGTRKWQAPVEVKLPKNSCRKIN